MTRFKLYMKQTSDGSGQNTDCPFSQRVLMFISLKKLSSDVEQIPIDILNKPKWFLEMNPEGKVPVLVDTGEADKIVADSEAIVQYLSSKPNDPQCIKCEPAVDAISKIFPTFAGMIKCKDKSETPQHKANLSAELTKMDSYLKTCGSTYLTADHLTDLDCSILPKLHHVAVAGKAYKNYEIPSDLEHLRRYIHTAHAQTEWTETKTTDQAIIDGWAKFDPLKE